MIIYRTKNSSYEEIRFNGIRAIIRHGSRELYEILGSFNPQEHKCEILDGIIFFDNQPLSANDIEKLLCNNVLKGNKIIAKFIDQYASNNPNNQTLLCTSSVIDIEERES